MARLNYNPHHYQRLPRTSLRDPISAILLSMGLGKTVITAVNDLLYDYFDVGKFLFIVLLESAPMSGSRKPKSGLTCKD